MALPPYVEAFLRVALLGFAGILFALLFAGYLRIRSAKLLLIALAFLVFAVKGLLLTLALFLPALFGLTVPWEVLVLDFLILVLLYGGTVKG